MMDERATVTWEKDALATVGTDKCKKISKAERNTSLLGYSMNIAV